MARPHRLLFVCTGNICRSPMAEYLARKHGRDTGVDLEVKSAGTLGLTDRPAEPKMVAVARELGIDMRPHVCQPLTDELVEWADRILVMEFTHHAHVVEFHPQGRGKTEMLGKYGGLEEIDDPIGAWFKWSFRKARDRIQTCVNPLIDRMPSEHDD